MVIIQEPFLDLLILEDSIDLELGFLMKRLLAIFLILIALKFIKDMLFKKPIDPEPNTPSGSGGSGRSRSNGGAENSGSGGGGSSGSSRASGTSNRGGSGTIGSGRSDESRYGAGYGPYDDKSRSYWAPPRQD